MELFSANISVGMLEEESLCTHLIKLCYLLMLTIQLGISNVLSSIN